MARVTKIYDSEGHLAFRAEKQHGFGRFLYYFFVVAFIVGVFVQIVHAI